MNEEIHKLWENLPQEMKDATLKHKAAIKRVFKAQDQVRAWTEELRIAELCRRAEEQAYGQVSMRWNPDTNQMENPLEEIRK